MYFGIFSDVMLMVWLAIIPNYTIDISCNAYAANQMKLGNDSYVIITLVL